jgi:hypothetical protein
VLLTERSSSSSSLSWRLMVSCCSCTSPLLSSSAVLMVSLAGADALPSSISATLQATCTISTAHTLTKACSKESSGACYARALRRLVLELLLNVLWQAHVSGAFHRSAVRQIFAAYNSAGCVD